MYQILLTTLSSLDLALPPAETGKDEFVFNNRDEVESIDPAFATGVPDNTLIVQMFEGLMARKADWATIVPGQAESYSLSKDQKIYTFKLRPNLKWSDGSPLKAEDFVYSWLRALHPKTMAAYVNWLTDNIVGAADYHKTPTPENAKKVKVTATDDRTLVVELIRPLSYFLQLTAESIFFPVNRAVIEKHADKWTRVENIVSNGPFKLAEWKIRDRVVMEKNPHYWDTKNVKLSRLVALPITDRQTAVNMFKQGKIDWSGTNGAPNSLVPAFKDDPNFRLYPGFVTYFYRFNTTKPGLNNPKVRQALSLAIDRKQLVEKVTRGGETPATAFVPPNTGTYKSPNTFISTDHEANVKQAKKLLTDAGYPNGKGLPTFNILYNTDENHKRIALAIQQMWKKELGVEAKPFNQEWKVYLKSQTNLDYEVSRSGWSGDYPDPTTFLDMFLSNSGNNQTGWKNETYDKLFFDSNNTTDPKKRQELLAKAEKLLVEEGPIAPIFYYMNFSFVRPEVVGFEPNLVDRPFAKYISKK